MGLLKKMLKHNPFDALAFRYYRKLEKKGIHAVEEFSKKIYWGIGYIFFPKILRITNKLTWEGDENIPRDTKGFVVISNHGYALDPFYASVPISCGKVHRKVHWVSKKEILTTPIMKSITWAFGTIPLNKKRKMTEKTRKLIEFTLRKGYGVGMFPEGRRYKDGKLHPFKTGAARICLKYKVPYLPVAMIGPRAFFKGKTHIRVGKPVYLDPTLPCTVKIAREIAEDMHMQVKALLEGRPQPKCRYEVPKEEAYEYIGYGLKHYVPTEWDKPKEVNDKKMKADEILLYNIGLEKPDLPGETEEESVDTVYTHEYGELPLYIGVKNGRST